METTQTPRPIVGPSGPDPSRVVDVSAYVCVAVGYLYAVLAAQHLTWLGFALFTALNVVWVVVFWYLSESPYPVARPGLIAVVLIVLALAAQGTVQLGVEFDWLIPVISAAILFIGWSVRRALVGTVVIFVMTALTLIVVYLTSGAQGPVLFRGVLASVLPIMSAYIFVAIFSVVLQRQQALRERAETLAAEVSAAKTELEEANARLRRFAQQVEELTITRERNRMAREIHDTLGHYLTILAVKLETATRLEERADPRLHAELIEARRVASECLAEVRHSVTALRPADPTAASLAEAMRQLVHEFEATAPDVAVALDLEGDTSDLAPELRLALYRCAQEALTNVRKHAHASNMLLRVRPDPDAVELTVLDNGVGARGGSGDAANATGATDAAGVAAGSPSKGFGLLGMRERIALLGGTVSAGAEPEHGWRVQVRVPRNSANASAAPGDAHAARAPLAPVDAPISDAVTRAAGGAI